MNNTFKINPTALRLDAKKNKNLIIVHNFVFEKLGELESLEFITSGVTISKMLKEKSISVSPSTCGRALTKMVDLGILKKIDKIGNTGTLYEYIMEEA